MMGKFIGMMMSSNRLPFNQAALIDLDDLHRARQIQLTYLPVNNLETERYELYGYNESSALVGGDYFDYFRLRESSLQCVLADASGHGLSAALIMSAFRGMLHAEIDEMQDCGDLFTALNRAVHTGSSTVQYLTSVFIDFNEEAKLLKYANAGHFEPAIIRADAALHRLSGGGPPLGMFGHSHYASAGAEIQPGDLLVMFTDGFTDLRNGSDDFFGEQRILDLVREHRTRPLREIASVLLNEGTAFSVAPKPEDDLTLFLLRFR
jgi:serine phosphatase RsbU (regulator of sigma subunit)